MTDPILEILILTTEFLLIAVNMLAWVLADLNRPKNPPYKMGDFVPIKQGRMSLPETSRI